MIDHLLGRPSAKWRRTQVFLVLFFWLGSLSRTPANGPRFLGIRKFNRALVRFTPYQIVLCTLTAVYAIRHLDHIIGLEAPEPLARLYAPSFYRATWIATAFDAGISSALSVRPLWLRDLCGFLFGCYYAVYADEADEKLRKFRAVATVEMLRACWEKQTNPYLRLISASRRPSIPIVRSLLLARPSGSKPPIKALLFFDGTVDELARCRDVILDFPGGGFICMGPNHHEERLRRWSRRVGREARGRGKIVVLSIDYGKSPEYPYPWAIEECFDAYLALVKSKGSVIGMKSGEINMVLCGDSAGANIVATVMLKILEHPDPIPTPVSLLLAYACLDFNFTSWMSPDNLRVLRSEQSSTHLPGMEEVKDHLAHRSPLAVVDDIDRTRTRLSRKKSWSRSIGSHLSFSRSSIASLENKTDFDIEKNSSEKVEDDLEDEWRPLKERVKTPMVVAPENEGEDYLRPIKTQSSETELSRSTRSTLTEKEEQEGTSTSQHNKSNSEANRPSFTNEKVRKQRKSAPIGTRLTMTSRSGYFQDRIISPSMMRAMAILYIGPKQNPDFQTDYYISPILAPSALLALFPPVLMICGEKDPFVDDTVIWAGRIREAKRARKAEAARQAEARDAIDQESLMIGRSRSGSVEIDVNNDQNFASAVKDTILEEEEEDWVQVKIFEGWGHGFLQMATLMSEMDQVYTELADWMACTFANLSASPQSVTPLGPGTPFASEESSKGFFASLFSSRKSPLKREPSVVGLATPRRREPSTFLVIPPPTTSSSYPDPGELSSQDPSNMTEDDLVIFTPKQCRTPPTPVSILKKARQAAEIQKLTPDEQSDQEAHPGRANERNRPGPKTFPSILASALSRSSSATHGSGTGSFRSSSVPPSFISAPRFTPAGSITPQTPLNLSNAKNGAGGGSGGGENKLSDVVSHLNEKELMRRRREEAVFGMGDVSGERF
ncbi:Hormone-sensitive lipase HSL [Phaffia rhodozyma]|uniref:Hormone-sensitive lipase HSL n=1 Tax=Phaffia rhodozyma TaxID=264483 RepID=A0A0F7SS93_PHARH|nr:Hormone-sensitive lipase HSL [Phaffia rhodozyma]